MREIGSGLVRIEVEGRRADVILDRPAKRNAMNMAMIDDLTAAVREVDTDDDIWAATLLGDGPVFCAGMDLEMMEVGGRAEHRERAAAFRELLDAIDATTTPVVASIKRAAVAGAFELTLPADFRIIGQDAKYGVVEVKLGIFPSGGSTQRLPRLVGLAKAKELVLTGEYIDPAEAERCDLVTEVVAPDAVDERAREIADELTKNAPLGIRQAMTALGHAFDVPLDDGLDIERYLANELYDTRDKEEGIAARREDREPEFEGR